MKKYTLMIHGGAGAIQQLDDYRPSLQMILEKGSQMLGGGRAALDVVEYCVRLLEDDPLFNAGRGSVLNVKGEVEMDAGIMDGKTCQAGAVAAVREVKNPISLARKVMEQTEHVLLVGEGAMEFAEIVKAPRESVDYFVTERRRAQLKQAQQGAQVVLDHSAPIPEKKLGTVGAVALDQDGNLAAATSSGGLVNKKFGRVGDSAIVGAGVFADNETCAVSTTGIGEQMIRTALAKTIADFIFHNHMNAEEAAKAGLAYFMRKVNSIAGAIVIDKDGNCFGVHSSPSMLYGWVRNDGAPELGF